MNLNSKKYEYVTSDVQVLKNISSNEEDIVIPDGRVVAMGVVLKGNAEDRIVNASVLDRNNEIIRPADVTFFQKTTGGNFLDGFMPVDFDGGRTYQARLSPTVVSAVDDLTAQFIFIVEKPQR
jgi:hypothetical protein